MAASSEKSPAKNIVRATSAPRPRRPAAGHSSNQVWHEASGAPRQGRPAPTGQQCETIIQMGNDLLKAKRGSVLLQLNGERDTVETPTDCGNSGTLSPCREKSDCNACVLAMNSLTALCPSTWSGSARCCDGTSSGGTR